MTNFKVTLLPIRLTFLSPLLFALQGLFWSLACIWLIYPEKHMSIPHLKNEPMNSTSAYPFLYTSYLPTEFLINGIVSACLTIVNVICIFITAIIVLKIKEVSAPYTASPDLKR
ncbi:GL18961 [Drosophila persimilis]|uniref:GL18961 n=1 Tax=Drosophila persimilis TaxID=7234 RepID=B4G7M1_DROPE|nr:GL18961 [Drosophila persimilis]